MNLDELYESDFGENPSQTLDDTLTQKRLDDTRKPKITLQKLNRLRKLRELKKFQELKRSSLVMHMYKDGDGGSF